jgi:small ligand-binding sensory domain FIST
MASASGVPLGNRLLLDDDVYDAGAVAIEIDGPVQLRTVVSQGCRPIGRPFIVTRAERNVIAELGRRNALEVLKELFAELPPEDQELVQRGLHIGRVINEYQESFHRGDFLVRNVMGADEAGGIALTDVIKVGQTVQFHVRDSGTADEDLRTLLETELREHPDEAVRGALLFTCNGRGTRLFDTPNHDVGVIHQVLGPVPVAGFFAMGELGPVGGQNFVHGFTASVVLFTENAAGA